MFISADPNRISGTRLILVMWMMPGPLGYLAVGVMDWTKSTDADFKKASDFKTVQECTTLS